MKAVRIAGFRWAWFEVFVVFLRLGLTAFGGPIAHLGYFRAAIVERRKWLSEAAYAELVALCQFLPGPASSQVAFGIGLLRAGPLGAIAAWVAFSAPSALLMLAFAFSSSAISGPVAAGVLHGLKLVAVAVVAQAVWGMARTLAPDVRGAAIALVALVTISAFTAGLMQIGVILFGALAGVLFCRVGPAAAHDAMTIRLPRSVGIAALAMFFALLLLPPLIGDVGHGGFVAYFGAFYRSGAMVFGGGHVVLPLLNEAVVTPGWIAPDRFLAGYGAAQALPGPLFSIAAYLGAILPNYPNGVAGAAMAVIALSLPGLLILLAVLPFWHRLRPHPLAQAAMAGANASVVGLLGAALYDPIWRSAVLDRMDFAAAAAGFVLLTLYRIPPIAVVVLGAGFGAFRAAAF